MSFRATPQFPSPEPLLFPLLSLEAHPSQRPRSCPLSMGIFSVTPPAHSIDATILSFEPPEHLAVDAG